MENFEQIKPTEEAKEEAKTEENPLADEVLEERRRHGSRHPVQTFPLPVPHPWSRVGNGRNIVR